MALNVLCEPRYYKYYKLYLQANRSNVQLKKKIHSDEIKLTTLQKQSEQDHAELNELKSKYDSFCSVLI
jgi:chaperonin cofactor prefoldin